MRIRNSLTFRLTLYFALLTALPLVIFSLYFRYAVTQYYYSIGSHFLQEQAESIAEHLEYLDEPISFTESLFAPTKDEQWVFVINHQEL